MKNISLSQSTKPWVITSDHILFYAQHQRLRLVLFVALFRNQAMQRAWKTRSHQPLQVALRLARIEGAHMNGNECLSGLPLWLVHGRIYLIRSADAL